MKDEGNLGSPEGQKGEKAAEARREPEDELLRCRQDLEAAKSELDAFLYSVSHDFGAPLRALSGFSQILLKRYAETLDENGRHYLAIIDASSRKIEQMVGSLLQISRLARVEMKIADLDLSGIAGEIACRLGKSFPERQVEFVLPEGIRGVGDQGLITFALENLLDNAWKSTARKAGAVIEFGVMRRGDEQVYFVRDNGIGFDMTRADRLFQPFQKLHGESEFPGSGVGLAAVQRIISRSGGETWAESVAGKGTTIHFTLGIRS